MRSVDAESIEDATEQFREIMDGLSGTEVFASSDIEEDDLPE